MQHTSGQLKYAAKYKLRKLGLRPILTTLIFLVICAALGFMALQLIGYTDYLMDVYGEYVNVLAADYGHLGDTAESFAEIYSGMLEGLYTAMENVPEWTIPPIGGVLAAALMLMLTVFHAGYTYYCFLVSREETAKLRDIMAGFSCMGKILMITIIRGVLTFAGLMLFFLPGIILWYRYRLVYFVLSEHPEYGVFRCLREAAKAGSVIRLIGLDLSFLGWHILNYILMMVVMTPVALLWIMPFAHVTRAMYYNKSVGWTPSMKADVPEEEGEDDTEES